jgi:hypothetical protein
MAEDILDYVQINASGEVEPVLDLSDANFIIKAESFKVIPPTRNPVVSQDNRRWGGGRQVGETNENGAVEWIAGVAASAPQACLEKVEEMLARLEANPSPLYLLWQPEGATEPTLYEVRGTAAWTPEYDARQFAGASLFPFTVHVPVAPLALGLPVTVLESEETELPATFSLEDIPGDAPAKAEVTIAKVEETAGAPEDDFITTTGTFKSVAVGNYVYWAGEEGSGYIGRAALDGSGADNTWLNTGVADIGGIAFDETYIYWTTKSGETDRIGRATIEGAEIEPDWISLPSGTGVLGIAVNSTHVFWTRGTGSLSGIGRANIDGTDIDDSAFISAPNALGIAISAGYIYWTNRVSGCIGRATIEGKNVELSWLGGGGTIGEPVRVAVSEGFIYWTDVVAGKIGRATIEGHEVNPTWQTAAEAYGLAVQSPYAYWAGGESVDIGRVLLEAPTPVFALLGWATRPAAGLATPPFGILDSSEATASGAWTYQDVEDARGGKALIGDGSYAFAEWDVDPATMVPDSFSGEIAVEVWARSITAEGAPVNLTLSARPQDGAGYGAPRFTDEWGSAGRALPEQSGFVVPTWRLTRLGTLHLLVNPLAPRVWVLLVEATCGGAVDLALDYLLIVPAKQRACSPSSKPHNESYPDFISNTAATVKTIKHDLSALIRKPEREFGHPDHGLGGQLLEFPSGETDLLVKLSSLVPDNLEVNGDIEQLAHEAAVTVVVTPRWFLTRT